MSTNPHDIKITVSQFAWDALWQDLETTREALHETTKRALATEKSMNELMSLLEKLTKENEELKSHVCDSRE